MQNTAFDNVKFITIVQMQPALWDNSDPDYSDKIKKDKAWRAVMTSVYGDEEVQSWDVQKKNEMGKELQRKWKNLRNSFAREMAKRKKTASGSSRPWRTYIYFDQLSFLIPTMRHSESGIVHLWNSAYATESDFNPIEEEASFESEYEGDLSVPHSSSSEQHSRKRKLEPDADLAQVLANNLKWMQEKEDAKESDPDRLFLLSLLDDFKKIPSNKKSAVKIAIIKAIDDGRFEHP